MKVVCAWCEKVIKEKIEPFDDKKISHGICEDCSKKLRKDEDDKKTLSKNDS